VTVNGVLHPDRLVSVGYAPGAGDVEIFLETFDGIGRTHQSFNLSAQDTRSLAAELQRVLALAKEGGAL
jgi:hypothetical protein